MKKEKRYILILIVAIFVLGIISFGTRWFILMPIQVRDGLVYGKYETPLAQIKKAEEWNNKKGWGFTQLDFIKAYMTAPLWPADEDKIVVLVPYLKGIGNGPRSYSTNGARTIRDLYEVIVSHAHVGEYSFPVNIDWAFETADGNHQTTEQGLKWEVIDLSPDWGTESERSVITNNAVTLPHAGMMAAFAWFDTWTDEFLSSDSSCYILGGYNWIHLNTQEEKQIPEVYSDYPSCGHVPCSSEWRNTKLFKIRYGPITDLKDEPSSCQVPKLISP